MELFKIRQQEILAQRVACAYHKAAGLQRAHAVQLILRRGDEAYGLIGIAVQHPSFAGKRYAAAGTGEQGAAQSILKPVHGLAYCGLANVKLPRGMGKASAARNGAEYAV